MKVAMLSGLLVVILSVTSVATAQESAPQSANDPVRAQQNKNEEAINGKWVYSATSALSSQGMNITNPSACEKFAVEISDKHFQFKLRCGSHFSSGLLPLVSDDEQYQIRRQADAIMIVKMGYYGLKLQTGKARRELVKIPYVEEIYRVKVVDGKSLSFYREQFKVDDYGRVVQSNYLQAYGLSKTLIKISSVDKGN